MDRDLTIMIYGAIMGVVGSIISSLVTMIFQLWLARRENARKQSEQLRRIHLPTDEDVRKFSSKSRQDDEPEGQRKAAETGSLVLSIFVSSFLVYKTNDVLLGFAFSAFLGFLLMHRVIRSIRRYKPA